MLVKLTGYGCHVPVEYNIDDIDVMNDVLIISVTKKVYNYNRETGEETFKSESKLKYHFEIDEENYYLIKVEKQSSFYKKIIQILFLEKLKQIFSEINRMYNFQNSKGNKDKEKDTKKSKNM